MFIQYSENSLRTKGSEIRELLRYTRIPGIISFAGGLPDPGLFPLEHISRITKEVLAQKGILALQYGPTPGEPDMIQALIRHMNDFGETAGPDEICVTSSSQQGLDLTALVLADEGSEIILELPSYLGAIQAFERAGVVFNGIPLQHDGLDVDLVEQTIQLKQKSGKKIRFIYTIPDYQNPSGIVMSLEKRHRLIDIAARYEVPIIEDSPYREISFTGKTLPSLWTLSGGEGVIQLKTFSKMLFPGMRLGWITAKKDITTKFALMKQSVDLCSPSFNQFIIAQFIQEGRMKTTIEQAIDCYKTKSRCMLESLRKNMPEYITWSEPDGGMFLWVTLPAHTDAKQLVEEAAANGVVFVTGKPFHCDGSGKNTLRLNYSFPTLQQIETGIQRLAMTIKKYCSSKTVLTEKAF